MSLPVNKQPEQHADVLIISCDQDDIEFLTVRNNLLGKKQSVLAVSQLTAGRLLRLSHEISNEDGCKRRIFVDGVCWILDKQTTVWVHLLCMFRTSSTSKLEVYKAYESLNSLMSFLSGIPCRWVPGTVHSIDLASQKPFQLQCAIEIGFKVPDTLITDEPKLVYDFYRKHNANIVSKTLTREMGLSLPDVSRYTQRVFPSDLLHLQSLPGTPVIFQASVPKIFEIRVTVVGDEIFAATIHSQETPRTKDDWRKCSRERSLFSPCKLPSSVASKCIAITKKLGLLFGAIDIIVTPNNDYVFLEINPAGRWQWVQEYAGLPIENAICRLLCGGLLNKKED